MAATLASLRRSDWNQEPIVILDDPCLETAHERKNEQFRRLLEHATGDKQEMVLLLEDDVVLNLHIRRNLELWRPLGEFSPGKQFFASLYNPAGVQFSLERPEESYAIAVPASFWGSQAILVSRSTLVHMLRWWNRVPGPHIDIKLSRLAAEVCRVVYHVPSLAEHVGYKSAWGGPFSRSRDFKVDWEACDKR